MHTLELKFRILELDIHTLELKLRTLELDFRTLELEMPKDIDISCASKRYCNLSEHHCTAMQQIQDWKRYT